MPASPSSADDLHKGRHHEFIKNTLHGTFKSATLNRGLALSAATLKPEAWYATSHTLQHDKLKAANLKAWASQNKVDVLLAKLDIYTFAAPLLQAKLKERCGVDIDVKTTWLRLYMPKDKPWWAIDISGGPRPARCRCWMPHCTISPKTNRSMPPRRSSANPMRWATSRCLRWPI
nr:hypothetical protein [Pseudomonas sp. Seg1]